jgi:hypothetical protein
VVFGSLRFCRHPRPTPVHRAVRTLSLALKSSIQKLSCTGSSHPRIAPRRRTPTGMRVAIRSSVLGGQTLTGRFSRISRFTNRCFSSSVSKHLTSSTIRNSDIRIKPSAIRRWARLRRLSVTRVTCKARCGSNSRNPGLDGRNAYRGLPVVLREQGIRHRTTSSPRKYEETS